MTERPILFSAPMVRAILEGRKTQTRRVMKDAPIERNGYLCTKLVTYANEKQVRGIMPSLCPYGQPGDRLWVRETWTHTGTGVWRVSDVNLASDGKVLYAATDEQPCSGCWFPSIHMYRRHSRITLEITDVRVQRLQDISEEDAASEGVEKLSDSPFCCTPWRNYLLKPGQPFAMNHSIARASFMSLWQSINAKRGFDWAVNPWVWAVTFKRVQQ